MNAQEKWKTAYYFFKVFSKNGTATEHARDGMLEHRREAALERKLAAAQRTIEALQMEVYQLEAQEHNRDDGNEWEKEYYLRGMHR